MRLPDAESTAVINPQVHRIGSNRQAHYDSAIGVQEAGMRHRHGKILGDMLTGREETIDEVLLPLLSTHLVPGEGRGADGGDERIHHDPGVADHLGRG
jgi:hypothetical protein